MIDTLKILHANLLLKNGLLAIPFIRLKTINITIHDEILGITKFNITSLCISVLYCEVQEHVSTVFLNEKSPSLCARLHTSTYFTFLVN